MKGERQLAVERVRAATAMWFSDDLHRVVGVMYEKMRRLGAWNQVKEKGSACRF